MKKIKILLPALAVVLALTGAFSTVPVQQGWYDANGASSGGGTPGRITKPSNDTPVCAVQSGIACILRINSVNFFVYDTKEHAEAGGATGLLKYTE